MNKLASLAAFSVFMLAGCEPCEFEPEPFNPGPELEQRLEQGQWNFSLSSVEISGDCEVDSPGPDELNLRGSIFYTQGLSLEIEIEGLLLVGQQEGNTIFAEGSEWYDVAEESNPVPNDDEDEDVSEDDDGDRGDGDECGTERCIGEEDTEELPPAISVYIDGLINSPVDLRGEVLIEQNLPGNFCLIQARYIGWFNGDKPVGEPAPASAETEGSEGSEPQGD